VPTVTARGKVLLVSFFVACGLASLGIYAWHQAVLDDLDREDAPYTGALLDRVLAPLKTPVADRASAEALLLGMPEWDRDRIVDALSRDPDKEPRLVAIAVARKIKDRPIPRAVLARMTLEDPDNKVKEAARKALNGEPP
jgi:hypothetical protein